MLQNWPIRSKLVVILIVPLVALAVLSAIQVRGNVESVQDAQRTKALAGFSVEANKLVNALQSERLSSHSVVVAAEASAATQEQISVPAQTLATARTASDAAIKGFRDKEGDLPESARSVLSDLLAGVDDKLGKLKAHRTAVDARTINLNADVAYYDPLISNLLALDGEVATGNKDAALVYGAGTLVAISQAKEAFSQVSGGINRVLLLSDLNAIGPTQNYIGQQTALLAQYQSTATAAQKQYLTDTIGSTSNPASLVSQVNQMRDNILATKSQGQTPSVNALTWIQSSQGLITKMQQVETKVSNDLVAEASRISSDATKNSIINSLVVALILLLSVLISLLVASPMIRQLRRLREGALEVADHRLPDVVERLHKGEPVDLDAESFPVPASTRDEIGQVAEAFGTVHQVAVRTAVEQAAMRKSIGDTFLNLARRSQALIHRQLKIIDALERKETDPDELEELFRLDHLATRMRRHAEDLIVLSGSKPARGWRRPVPIKDVVRGAVAEVEDYTRVKVLPVGGGAISGHAVGDVIHMLAELIENATSFSPPHTPVHVTGHEVSNGFAIEIEDRGLGMNPAEFKGLNDRLENPPPFDLTTSERLGLFVVGRLAERHGIKVRLRTSPYGGTMAIVLIPGTMLRPVDDDLASVEPGGRGDALELAAVGAGSASKSAAETEALELAPSGGMLALPAGPAAAADFDEIDELGGVSDPAVTTGAFDRRSGPSTGALALPGPAGALSPDELPAPPPLTDPIPPVPPPLPPEQTGPRAMFGASTAKGDDEPLLDDLPVFATVRSSWFISDRPRRTPAADPVLGSAPAPTAPIAPAARPSYPPAFAPSVTPTQGPAGGAPDLRFGDLPNRTSPRHQPMTGAPLAADPLGPAVPHGPAAPLGPATPAGGYAGPGRTRGGRGAQQPVQTTEVGLPRRTRRANLAPELRRDSNLPANPSRVVAGPRSPEEIRSMMSSFQANFGRGLADAHGSHDGDDQRKVT